MRVAPYTSTHDPAHARIHAVLGGYVVVWYWPERRVASNRPLTRKCEHVHRSHLAAIRCARTRTKTVKEA